MPPPVPHFDAAASTPPRSARRLPIAVASIVALIVLLSTASLASPSLQPFSTATPSVPTMSATPNPTENNGRQRATRDTDVWTDTKKVEKGVAWIGFFLAGSIAAVLGTLLWVIVTWIRENAPAKRAVRQASASDAAGRAETIDEDSLASDLAHTLLEDDGDLITACWHRLEKAADAVGTPRHPTETSTDFTMRVMSSTSADPQALETLGGLYREATYSPHPQTDAMVADARAAVERIVATLTARKTR